MYGPTLVIKPPAKKVFFFKNPQLKILQNKPSIFVPLTLVILCLKRDEKWHTLTIYNLSVYNVNNLVENFFYDSKIVEGFYHGMSLNILKSLLSLIPYLKLIYEPLN